jgi:UrcA family protein
MRILTKTALSLVAIAAIAAPAAAAEPSSYTNVRTVAYADLNLESDNGRVELQRRLMRAAKSLCATNPVAESAAVRAEREACEVETAASFDAQITAAVQANRARATAYASR